MNRRQIFLRMLLEELGIPPSVATFDDRLVLQKAVYLAQQLGADLGYHFSWYLRGPYCKDLTADVYDTVSSPLPDGWEFSESAKQKLANAREMVAHAKSAAKGEALVKEFEKLASVLFVIKTGQAKRDDAGDVTKRLTRAGKTFSQQEVDAAMAILRRHGAL